jgi:hypothetical protein
LSVSISLFDESAMSATFSIPISLVSLAPGLDGALCCLVAGVDEVESASGLVVGHRAFWFTGAQCLPGASLGGVGGAVDGLQLHGRRVLGEPVEHASGSDRGELLAVADDDRLRACALDKLGEDVEALVVDHPCLIKDDRRVGTDANGPSVGARDERVERQRVSLERWTVDTQPLGG